MCIAAAIVGGAVVGGVAQSRSAGKAADAQTAAAQQGAAAEVESNELAIAEQRRQFDSVVELLKPYVEAGTGSLAAQEDLLGINGPEPQAAAIDAIKASPQFTSIVETGEEALLQNASATGGLRGGNLQGALAQFRPQVLSQLIESQFGKLGQLTGMGQASASGQAAAGQNTGNIISQLLSNSGLAQSGAFNTGGAAQAGASMATGQAFANAGNSLSTLGILKGMKVF